MKWIENTYNVNGYEVHARYTKENIDTIFLPLIQRLQSIQEEEGKRILIFIAAPPACGKSTFVTFLCELAKQQGYDNMQAVGMDGFHYRNEYLDFHFIKGKLLRDVKGCPESFDLDKLSSCIIGTKSNDMDWPEYDRSIHNPREHAIRVDKDIVLIEGNYLLLNEDGWKGLKKHCDYSIYIQAKEDILEKRLIDRKAKSTNTRAEAIAFYEKSDKKNIQRVLHNTLDADCVLRLDEKGIYHLVSK